MNAKQNPLWSVLLPFGTALVSMVLGAGVGAGITYLVVAPGPVPPPTVTEVAALCAPDLAAKQAEVDEATDEVARLGTEVNLREVRVAELEAEMARRADRGRAVARELDQARAELARVREELAVAVVEQTRLAAELDVTVARLAETEIQLTEQTRLTGLAEDDALTNRWFRFVNDAQLEICEKGGRKKLGKCRETVTAKVGNDRVRSDFEACVRSGAATPHVAERERDAGLPRFARAIDDADRVTEGWFVAFCDPSLPEADGPAFGSVAPPVGSIAAGVLALGLDD